MTAVFICEANIKQFKAQILEARPDLQRATLRILLLEEQAKLLILNKEPSPVLEVDGRNGEEPQLPGAPRRNTI